MSLEKVLPPGVNGKISGQVKVKVDEVFWTRKSSEEIFVELEWWGEKEKSVFRPQDITFNEAKKSEDTIVTYNIRTNPGLFETYLRNCVKIIFQVHKRSNRNVIVGSAIVKDIDQIIAHRNYQSYFPIFSPKGNRIGDLHIGFEIVYNQKESCFRLNHATIEPYQAINIRKKVGVECKPNSPLKSASEPSSEDKVLSEVLQRGHELRRAMVMSVLQDCPIDSLETVVNYRSDVPPTTKLHSKRQEAKLIDFLLGKEMTAEEEVKALETLRCISPAESLVEIAKAAPVEEDCKVTKSKCCLHGKRCRKGKKAVSCVSEQSVLKTKSDTGTSSGVGLRGQSLSEPSDRPPTSISLGDKQHHFERFDDFEQRKPLKPKKEVTNCYRLTLVHLTLTSDGVRKIHYAPGLKGIEQPRSKHARNHHPPGTSFTVELTFPSRSGGHQWVRTQKFISKNYKGYRVYFGQSKSRASSGELTWSRLCSLLQGCMASVSWRHLNQRIPCPLGNAVLDSVPPDEAPSTELTLPVISNTRLLTGQLRIRIDLGHVNPRGGGPVFPEGKMTTKATKTEEDGLEQENFVDLEEVGQVTKTRIIPEGDLRKQSDLIETAVSKEPATSSDGETSVNPEHCLDAELLRAIDLLNSGADRQEAYVQTTLPLTECPTCRTTNIKVKDDPPVQHKTESSLLPSTREVMEDHRRRDVEDEWHLDPDMMKKHNSRRTRSRPQPPRPPEHDWRTPGEPEEAWRKEGEEPEPGWLPHSPEHVWRRPGEEAWRKPEELHPPEPAWNTHLPETVWRTASSKETVHEFTLKVDRISGVPLFTGDTDADCYVDYAFPEVDCTGKLVYSRVCSGTEMKMALRQIEFSTVTRHSLRLRSPLTQALLSLSSHNVPLWLWTRLYHPPPYKDYKLAQASISLTKLSNLELKYEQQLEKKAVFEKIVLPLIVVESSVTSGYRGNFGEIEVTLGYSCASMETYRDWITGQGGVLRERTESQRPLGDCGDKTDGSPNHWHQFDTNVPSNSTQFRTCNGSKNHQTNCHFDYLQAQKYEHYRPYCACAKYGSHSIHHCSSNSCSHGCGHVVSSQSYNSDPFRKMDGDYGEDPRLYRTDENRTHLGRGVVQRVLREMQQRRMQLHVDPTAKENLCPNKFTEERNSADSQGTYLKDFTGPKMSGSGDRQENVISLQRVSPVGGGGDMTYFAPDLTQKDAFESFDLRVDLPDKDETEDFEVRSRLSFLQTPPPDLPMLPGFKHCKDMVYLESDSSSSIRERIQKQDVKNPFSSNSNMSLCVDSDSSMFKIPDPPRKSGNQKEDSDKEITGKDVEVINVKNKRKIKRSKQKKQPNEFSHLDKDNIISDNTLNSVESLLGDAGRESRDVGVATEMAAENKDTQTSYSEENLFRARVEICRALGLPSMETRLPDGRMTLVKPSSFAYFSARQDGKDVILKTPIVEKKTNPVWDSVWEVQLPVELLKKCDSELEICVEVSGGGPEAAVPPTASRSSDPLFSRSGVSLLRASIDLTPVTAGLANASGWFSLADKACVCRAQIKAVVTPLEDASRFRDDWLREYTKARGRRAEGPSLTSTTNAASIATSLQEKLGELERLTQRMRDKMATRDRWELSSPFHLLEEVRDVSLPSFNLHGLVEVGTSPIVLSPKDEGVRGVDGSVGPTRRTDTSVIHLSDSEEKRTGATRKRSCSRIPEAGPKSSAQTPSLVLISDDDGDDDLPLGREDPRRTTVISISSEDEMPEVKTYRKVSLGRASSPLHTYTLQSSSGEEEEDLEVRDDEGEKESGGETPSETICRILGRMRSRDGRR